MTLIRVGKSGYRCKGLGVISNQSQELPYTFIQNQNTSIFTPMTDASKPTAELQMHNKARPRYIQVQPIRSSRDTRARYEVGSVEFLFTKQTSCYCTLTPSTSSKPRYLFTHN